MVYVIMNTVCIHCMSFSDFDRNGYPYMLCYLICVGCLHTAIQIYSWVYWLGPSKPESTMANQNQFQGQKTIYGQYL